MEYSEGKLNLSSQQDSPFGEILADLYYMQPKLLFEIKHIGYPHNGGSHDLTIMGSKEEIKAFLERLITHYSQFKYKRRNFDYQVRMLKQLRNEVSAGNYGVIYDERNECCRYHSALTYATKCIDKLLQALLLGEITHIEFGNKDRDEKLMSYGCDINSILKINTHKYGEYNLLNCQYLNRGIINPRTNVEIDLLEYGKRPYGNVKNIDGKMSFTYIIGYNEKITDNISSEVYCQIRKALLDFMEMKYKPAMTYKGISSEEAEQYKTYFGRKSNGEKLIIDNRKEGYNDE